MKGFELGADFLWWKPCVSDELDYGARFHGTPSTCLKYRYHAICPDWQPGVRVYVKMPDFYCDWGLAASYTFIESEDHGKVRGSGEIRHSFMHPGFANNDANDCAKGFWNARYNEWDVLLTSDACSRECHTFTHQFGLAGIVLSQHFRVHQHILVRSPSNTEESANWRSDFWGVGFRMGSEYQYRFSDCFRFFAKGQGTILAGKSEGRVHFENEGCSDNRACFHDAECCKMVPGYHLAAGFLYDMCWCDWDFSFKLGYEFLQWHNLPKHRVFVGDSINSSTDAIATSPSGRTLGFHGLTLGASVKF